MTTGTRLAESASLDAMIRVIVYRPGKRGDEFGNTVGLGDEDVLRIMERYG